MLRPTVDPILFFTPQGVGRNQAIIPGQTNTLTVRFRCIEGIEPTLLSGFDYHTECQGLTLAFNELIPTFGGIAIPLDKAAVLKTGKRRPGPGASVELGKHQSPPVEILLGGDRAFKAHPESQLTGTAQPAEVTGRHCISDTCFGTLLLHWHRPQCTESWHKDK